MTSEWQWNEFNLTRKETFEPKSSVEIYLNGKARCHNKTNSEISAEMEFETSHLLTFSIDSSFIQEFKNCFFSKFIRKKVRATAGSEPLRLGAGALQLAGRYALERCAFYVLFLICVGEMHIFLTDGSHCAPLLSIVIRRS